MAWCGWPIDRSRGARGRCPAPGSRPARRLHHEQLVAAAVPTTSQKLQTHGHAHRRSEDLISSPMAAASLLEAGERALVLGGPGILEALSERGVETVEPAAGGTVAADEGAPRRRG